MCEFIIKNHLQYLSFVFFDDEVLFMVPFNFSRFIKMMSSAIKSRLLVDKVRKDPIASSIIATSLIAIFNWFWKPIQSVISIIITVGKDILCTDMVTPIWLLIVGEFIFVLLFLIIVRLAKRKPLLCAIFMIISQILIGIGVGLLQVQMGLRIS